ncbi:hypothetical protein I6F50_09155 [Pseudoalteromonas sp. NZS127_1]|uniref:hypothetical protein n=1 Tax=Pseudoalteromonas sp. NZS127_1 TaxID=2792074 RepID=UPI0018CDA915|nr:hypothetical protein [Pseudoalteromonas sp. NZS127_1]MBG9995224.1 hypothetical protein [Pseudoalteromonas sp. NZS127_1]
MRFLVAFLLMLSCVFDSKGAIIDPAIPAPSLVPTPSNFRYEENNGSLRIMWNWYPNDGVITLPPKLPPPAELFSVPREGNYKYSIDVEIAELSNNNIYSMLSNDYRLLGSTISNSYLYNMAVFSAVKFRVRAKRTDTFTDSSVYSAYLYSPLINRQVKLSAPSISPDGGNVIPTDNIIITNAQQAVMKYALIPLESDCSSVNNWLTYVAPLSINSSRQLCVFATKIGSLSSDIKEAVYTVSSPANTKQIIFIHTDLLGSPVAESQGEQ